MGNEETGNRKRFQTIPSNVQNIHPRPFGPPPPAVDSKDALCAFHFCPPLEGAGGGWETGNRRQETVSNHSFQCAKHPPPALRATPASGGQVGMRFALFIKVFFHPWISTPGPSGHPRQRWTVGMRFRAVLLRGYFYPWTSTPGPSGHPRQRGTLVICASRFSLKCFFTPAADFRNFIYK